MATSHPIRSVDRLIKGAAFATAPAPTEAPPPAIRDRAGLVRQSPASAEQRRLAPEDAPTSQDGAAQP